MKRLIVLLVLAMATVSYAGVGIDISGSQYETKTSNAMRIRNMEVQGVSGKYWVDFQWDQDSMIFYPIGAGAESDVDPIRVKTEILIGQWQFVFTIISTFTEQYSLSNIDGSKNSQGGYFIFGTNKKSGKTIAASYFPNDDNWSLLSPLTSTISDFFIFKTDGTSILPNSCYYLFVNNKPSRCYSLSGTKTSASPSLSFLSEQLDMEDDRLNIEVDCANDPVVELRYNEMNNLMK